MGKANLEKLKIKVASQVGVQLSNYNGDITARQAGLIGGNMVKELIAKAEQNLSATYPENYDTGHYNTYTAINTNNSQFII